MSKLDLTSQSGLGLDQLSDLVASLLERVARLEEENAALREEIARLKGHKGRPRIKPSGMDKSAEKGKSKGKRRGKAKSGRGQVRRELAVTEEHEIKVEAPVGSRFKGFEDFVVQDLRLEKRVIRYRRERWLTPDGRTLVAPLPKGLCGHFGPELVRFVLLQHAQGQVTTERIASMLNAVGIVISKRQVVRFLNTDPADLAKEAEAVFRAGLETAKWITVDDTGARHAGKNGVTTQFGDDRFTFFATAFFKNRQNFLQLLRAGHGDYVLNTEAFDYMRRHSLAAPIIGRLENDTQKPFENQTAWSAHLTKLGIDKLDVQPDPVKITTEAALWGSIRHHDLLNDTVIVSDGAGQFRVGHHGLCLRPLPAGVHSMNRIDRLLTIDGCTPNA